VWRLLRLRGNFDVVATMGSRVSIAYGLACLFLGVPSKQIMTEFFLDRKKPCSIVWKIKTSLTRRVATRCIGILTNSSPEVITIARRLCIPESKLCFVPLYSTIPAAVADVKIEDYVFSGGRTSRDVATLLNAASSFPLPLYLVVGRNEAIPSPLPENVRVWRELSFLDYLDKLQRARMVVIPLLESERATGQVALFEAMALGKPIVATHATGTVDYIRDGINGMLTPPGNAEALADAIQHLYQHPEYADGLGRAARADCETRWTLEKHAELKLSAIHCLAVSCSERQCKAVHDTRRKDET
jgi:glycosyltransferase involved in cell wall biosynthesis